MKNHIDPDFANRMKEIHDLHTKLNHLVYTHMPFTPHYSVSSNVQLGLGLVLG